MLFTAANPPLNLSAIQLTITAVQVSWSAPASGAATVTGYDIYYETTGGSDYEQRVTVGAAATEYTLTVLEEERSYSISIVALSNTLPSILTGPILVSLGQQNTCIINVQYSFKRLSLQQFQLHPLQPT